MTLCLFALLIGLLPQTASANTEVRFCVPNQNNPPFYVVDGDIVGGNTIEHIRRLFAQPDLANVSLTMTLLPWQRCLHDIESGQIDMIVAGYSDERARRMLFPNQLGFDLDYSDFNSVQLCLVKNTHSNINWDGKSITGQEQIVIGIEPGFLLPHPLSRASQVSLLTIWDEKRKYDLLKRGRVDLVLVLCGLRNKNRPLQDIMLPATTELLYPAVINTTAYLVFSRSFYARSAGVARQIIATSNAFDPIDVYFPEN